MRAPTFVNVPTGPIPIDQPDIELALCAFLPGITAARRKFRLQALLNKRVDMLVLRHDLLDGFLVDTHQAFEHRVIHRVGHHQ